MKIHFLGANRQVTGSRYCLEVGKQRVMIDCGMFQERAYAKRNWAPCPLPAKSIDALLLTHAHLDHCGLIPRFVKQGYDAPIWATPPTLDLIDVILNDSAKIQLEDAEYKRRRHQKEGRKGRYPEKPLYKSRDVERSLALGKEAPYGEAIPICEGITATFHEAGHILGSAILEIVAVEGGEQRTILFSGDLGQWGKPLVRDPTLFTAADYVVMESTYGDRDHVEGGDIKSQLAEIINDTAEAGGKLLIPTFAVERAQELMYHISELVYDNQIPDMPIFLDSPMAVDVTDIFRRHRNACDKATWERINAGEPPLRFPSLHMTHSRDESIAINHVKGAAIIMASSGMCTGGRIKHHLRQNIGRPESTILFVGYQGEGTLGRQILGQPDEVRIHGRNFPLRASVRQIYGFSGHADRGDLLRWIGNLQQPPRHLFLTHGDEEAATALAKAIENRHSCPVQIPKYQDAIQLA